MRSKYILSGAIGGVFFAVPYLALNFGIVPSLVVGAAAFGASTLATKESELDNLSPHIIR